MCLKNLYTFIHLKIIFKIKNKKMNMMINDHFDRMIKYITLPDLIY